MTLRNVVITLCAIVVVFAIVQSIFAWAGWVPLGIEAAIVLALVVFERSRYQPTITTPASEFVATGERFEDPTSGKAVEVFANPRTGEREYR
jgi:hypothetical protein